MRLLCVGDLALMHEVLSTDAWVPPPGLIPGENMKLLFNWVFPETHPDWLCVPGPNCWPGHEEARRTIRELKREAEWILIVVHWSDEAFPYPHPEDRALARELAQTGADVVVGHHPHVPTRLSVLFCACNVPPGSDFAKLKWGPPHPRLEPQSARSCRAAPWGRRRGYSKHPLLSLPPSPPDSTIS